MPPAKRRNLGSYGSLVRACITCGRPCPPGRSRCEAHGGARAWKNRPKANQGAYGGDWPRIRLEVLRRDGFQCQLRFSGCLQKASEVDHIRGVSENGSNEPSNCRAACSRCHATRTGRQGARAANGKKKEKK